MRNRKNVYKYVIIFLCIFSINCNASRHVSSLPVTSGKTNTGNISLKIMTYNVHHCNPPEKQKEGIIDMNAVAEVIHKQMPDLVALQEIDDHTLRSGKNINEAEEIAKILKMHFYFAKAIDYAGGGYGIAVLSKYPLTETQIYYLPKNADEKTEQRVLLTARVNLPNGKSIRFASTHLDVMNLDNRVMQVEEISRIAEKDSIPFIIGGDFNSQPDSKAIKLFDELFQRSCTASCAFTIPSDHPSETIDYIAFEKKNPFRIRSHEVIPETYASDHRPVVTTFILP